MAWYQVKPKTNGDLKELTKSYNDKYGNYDYTQDSRSADRKFGEGLRYCFGNVDGLNVLVCGANSGYEIEFLSQYYPATKFTAVDISDEALNRLSVKFPEVKIVHANMESLPFEDKSFDIYINCRAIHSSDVDISKSVDEALRVTKERVVISVSNGYIVDGVIQNGMYDYDLGEIDPKKSQAVAEKIKSILIKKGLQVGECSSDAEIFLVSTI